MPFLPAFVLMTQAAQGPADTVTLRYRRPSAVVAQAHDLGATLVPDDARSRVSVSGTPEQVRDAKAFLRLFDVPRKPLLVRVIVSSPVDHLDWTVDARLTNGQRWRTADEETGSEVALEPRLGGDGVLQVAVLARCGRTQLGSTLRLAKGAARSISLGKRIGQRIDVFPGGKTAISDISVALPTVTIRYLGD